MTDEKLEELQEIKKRIQKHTKEIDWLQKGVASRLTIKVKYTYDNGEQRWPEIYIEDIEIMEAMMELTLAHRIRELKILKVKYEAG